MRPLRQVFPIAATVISLLFSPLLIVVLLIVPTSAQSDPSIAIRVLGPQWEQLSRRAGMIFAGTVLACPGQPLHSDHGVPSVEIKLLVDRAIVGVEPGQVLTIHEWTGALSGHPSMHPGEHLLLFLYPPSHLGLTSPVGGFQGQIRLDSRGMTMVDPSPQSHPESQTSGTIPPIATREIHFRPVTLNELERAIRAARGE